MAYGLKYKISFRNRQFSNSISDVYFVNIYQKDYIGIPTALTANENPFILKYQSGDDDPLSPIRASECEINYYNDGIVPLTSFYSEDDEEYRFDFYCQSIENTSINQLLWSGYMVQDSCQEQFLYPPYVVTLKGTDNLGLLKDMPLDIAFNKSYKRTLYEANTDATLTITDLHTIEITEPLTVVSEDVSKINVFNYYGIDYNVTSAAFDAGTHILTLTVAEEFAATGSFTAQSYTIYTTINLVGKISLYDIVTTIIATTGISLPLRVFSNLIENTTDDRTVSATATFLEQTFIHIGEFQGDDGAWNDSYSVLESICKTFNLCCAQAEGYWNIIRFPEANLFTDNQILGTLFPNTFDLAGASAITLDPNVEIDKDAQIIFLNADQISRITRPYRDVKLTFNYHQPKSLIIGSDLQQLGVLLATSNVTIDGVDYVYRDYDIPPYWSHYESDDSFIRVVSQLPTTDFEQETEKERYVVTPGHSEEQRGVQFNPIEVSKGDELDFSLQFRTETDSSDFLRFWISFRLYGVDGKYYDLHSFTEDGVGSIQVFWEGPFDSPIVDLGLYTESPSLQDTSQFTPWVLSAMSLYNNNKLIIPQDGLLVLIVHGTNGNTGSPRQETFWNEINLTFLNRINDNTKIIGQYHLQHQPETIKNFYDEEISIDDSPRNTIAGTLFTSAITDFGDLGQVYFTRTLAWHRLAFDETLRLGQITSYERKFLSYKARTVLEGTFYGLRYTKNDSFRFISLLNIIQVGTLPAKNFIFGLLTLNYMQATFEATMNELYMEDDAKEFDYTFKYIFEKT